MMTTTTHTAASIVATTDAEKSRLNGALEAAEREIRRERESSEVLRGRLLEVSQELGRESRRRERAEEQSGTTRVLSAQRAESRDTVIAKLQRQVDEDQSEISHLRRSVVTAHSSSPQPAQSQRQTITQSVSLPPRSGSDASARQASVSPTNGRLSPFPPKHDRPNEIILGEVTKEADHQILALNRQLQAAMTEVDELKKTKSTAPPPTAPPPMVHNVRTTSTSQSSPPRQIESRVQRTGTVIAATRELGEYSTPRPTPGDLLNAKMEVRKANTAVTALRKEVDYWKAACNQNGNGANTAHHSTAAGSRGRAWSTDPAVDPETHERLRREAASLRSENEELRRSQRSPSPADATLPLSPSSVELLSRATHYKSEAENLQQSLVNGNMQIEKLRSRMQEKVREADLLEAEVLRLRGAMSDCQVDSSELARISQEKDDFRERFEVMRSNDQDLRTKLQRSEAECTQLSEDLRGLMKEMEQKRRMTEAVVVKAAEFQDAQQTVKAEMHADKQEVARLRQLVAKLEDERERAGLRIETEKTARRTSTQLAAVFSLKISDLLNQLNAAVLPGLPQPSPIHDVVSAHTRVFDQLKEHCDLIVGQSSPTSRPLLPPPRNTAFDPL